MSDYKIHKSAEICHGCEGGFEDSQELFSAFCLEESEPARRDFCVSCFEKRTTEEKERDFAFWKTRKAGEGRVRRVVDFNLLREMFFKMAEQPGESYRKLVYLLGLVLLRKRAIRLVEFVSESGQDFLVITSKTHPEPLKVEAPELKSEEFEELRDKLRALLDIDFEEEGLAADPAKLSVEPDGAPSDVPETNDASS